MSYSRIFGSQFPNSVISVGSRKDVDNSVIDLINRYNGYVTSGDITEAHKLYNDNKDILEPYSFNSNYLNLLEEEIYNLGIGLISSMSTIISSDMPTNQAINGYWLEDYE